jgi:micrococcal nuclease
VSWQHDQARPLGLRFPFPGSAPASPGPTPQRVGGIDLNYAGACIPPPPPDLDCNQISARNFRAARTDDHHFDVDRDGILCEE